MSTTVIRTASCLALVAATACGDTMVEPRIIPHPTLTIVEGDGQVGSAGAPLSPLRVSIEHDDGAGVDDVAIVWVVTSGEGLFRVWADARWRMVDAISTRTGEHDEGIAEVSFVPTSPGVTTVAAFASASAATSPGSVTFTARTEGVGIVVNEPWAAEQPWPYGPQDVTVDLGTPVEWVIGLSGDGYVRSVSVPAGGTTFEGRLDYDGVSEFDFTPDVAGTWTWTWEWLEITDDMDWWDWGELHADTATIVVR